MSKKDDNQQKDDDLGDRGAATAIVWIAYSVLMGIIILNNAAEGVPYAAMISGVAFFTTLAIWNINVKEFFDSPSEAIKQKNKRGDQSADAMLMLMDLLSEEEKQDIKRRLMNSGDGEIPFPISDDEDTYQYNQR